MRRSNLVFLAPTKRDCFVALLLSMYRLSFVRRPAPHPGPLPVNGARGYSLSRAREREGVRVRRNLKPRRNFMFMVYEQYRRDRYRQLAMTI